MKYQIEQGTDDIKVYANGEEILFVKRRYSLLGKLYSSFYVNEELKLETIYNVLLFRKRYAIEYQNLGQSFQSITSRRGYPIAFLADNKLHMRRSWFKNPLFTLYENDDKVGFVTRKMLVIAKNTVTYHMEFFNDGVNNFYLLLLFLIDLAPFM